MGIIPLKWFFADHSSNPKIDPNTPLCTEDFEAGKSCKTQGAQCRLQNSIYACWPFDKMIRIQGKVVDSAGRPVAHARLTAGYSHHGYTDLVVGYSNEAGFFSLKYSSCLPNLYAQKDSFVDQKTEYYLHTQKTNCVTDNFLGSQSLKVVLNRTPRTVPKDLHPPSEMGECHITGRVVDADGAGIYKARVRTSESRFGTAYTDESGVYQLSGDAPCPTHCVATRTGYQNPLFGRYVYSSCVSGKPGDLLLIKNN